MVIVRDITDRKAAQGLATELALKAKDLEALERIDQLRKDLISTVSHELRTPLASIKGYISTLLQPDVKWEPELQREFLKVADQEAERLSRLIGDLLAMSQLEAGVLKLERERTSLTEVLEETVTQLRPMVSGHKLVMELPSGLPPVLVDRHRVNQVAGNLVGNAAKFSEPGTQITIGAEVCVQEGIVSVKDQGKGIEPDSLKSIFDPFVRAGGPIGGSRGGFGLGLSICHKLVQEHGGRLWVQSEPGTGSTFFFSLPVFE